MSSEILTSPLLGRYPELIHGFTTRKLGADYDRIAVRMKILSSQIYYVEQIHSGKVVVVDEDTELSQLVPADAMVTSRADVIIGVRTADCLPLLVYDPRQNVVAAIHAGYRGLLGGIIQNTLVLMQRGYGCELTDLKFVLGPAICVRHYEVGTEVIDEFRKTYGQGFLFRTDLGVKPHLDIVGTSLQILLAHGVHESNVHIPGWCTFEDEQNFHSYRRSPGSGRQFNFIGRLSQI
jgi:YfiH family protein